MRFGRAPSEKGAAGQGGALDGIGLDTRHLPAELVAQDVVVTVWHESVGPRQGEQALAWRLGDAPDNAPLSPDEAWYVAEVLDYARLQVLAHHGGIEGLRKALRHERFTPDGPA